MINQSPKHIIKNFKNRNVSIGNERRLNMAKTVLEHQPHFPRTLTYEDFDLTMFNWVDKSIKLVYDGNLFNTYKLFSNQRMTEYGQTWKNLDDKGNLDINFKTITREPNPQKGDIQGGNFTIPGDITFPIFKARNVDENGVEYTELYSMKQPTSVNLIYTIGVFTNSYSILNQMNIIMQKEFKSLEKYIFPNGFAIPMELNSISDESEYTIDDRKYYSQTYQIKVLGYIITDDDYVVTKIPSRAKIQFVSGRNSSTRRKKDKFDIQQLTLKKPECYEVESNCEVENVITAEQSQGNIEEVMTQISQRTGLEIEELCGKQVCWEDTEDEFYVNRKIVFNVLIGECENVCEFTCDYNVGIESLELKNIQSYQIIINGLGVNVEDSDVNILNGDVVRIEVIPVEEKHLTEIKIVTYDLDSIIDKSEEDSISVVDVS